MISNFMAFWMVSQNVLLINILTLPELDLYPKESSVLDILRAGYPQAIDLHPKLGGYHYLPTEWS